MATNPSFVAPALAAGPTNAELLARRAAAIPRGLGHATGVFASRARNAELWDVEGKRYVDFAAGIAVLNTGHCHPAVVDAVKAQLELFTHPCIQVVLYEPYIRLAERLNALAPMPSPLKTILFTTGAEATENAVKIARAATRRSGVLSFTGGFHGRTLMALAMTGKVSPYKRDFGPSWPDVWHAPFPVQQYGISVDDSIRRIELLLKTEIDAASLAAIIIEPVQGEGGFHPAPPQLLRYLRELCDRHGVVFIADEIQTGFGRTGRMFAMEHHGISPDLMCVAKSLGGGLPISAVVGRAALMDAAAPGGLGGTYAGNPLACAAALAAIDVIEKEGLISRASAIGEKMKRRLRAFAERSDAPPIEHIRGPGAMVAFDIMKQRGSNEPDADRTRDITTRAWKSGLILLTCGLYGNTIRLLVPLTASDAILDEGMSLLERALLED